MGDKGTNAFTSVEQTVYMRTFLPTYIDKFLALQPNVVRHPVLEFFIPNWKQYTKKRTDPRQRRK